MANGHGGARVGAGKKPADPREKFAVKIAAVEKRIADRLPEIADAMMELALGATVQEYTPEGEKRVYTLKPDFKAGSYLMDRLMGKPVTPVTAEVSGPDGGAILVAFGENVMKAYGDDHIGADLDTDPGFSASSDAEGD